MKQRIELGSVYTLTTLVYPTPSLTTFGYDLTTLTHTTKVCSRQTLDTN